MIASALSLGETADRAWRFSGSDEVTIGALVADRDGPENQLALRSPAPCERFLLLFLASTEAGRLRT